MAHMNYSNALHIGDFGLSKREQLLWSISAIKKKMQQVLAQSKNYSQCVVLPETVSKLLATTKTARYLQPNCKLRVLHSDMCAAGFGSVHFGSRQLMQSATFLTTSRSTRTYLLT